VFRFCKRNKIGPEQPFQLFQSLTARHRCLKLKDTHNSLIAWSFYFETREVGETPAELSGMCAGQAQNIHECI
jgi:hypothetical protein